MLLLTSCGDFLEESSQDEIKPTNTEDIASVLYSSAYPYQYSSDGYLVLLTDEVENKQYKLQSYAERMTQGKPVYTFSKTMFDGEESFINDENSWKNNYTQIKNCNVVLDFVYKMSGKEEDKRHIAGQARALRAFYYMKLLSIYCMPYNEATADSELGLCHMLSSNVSDAYPTRETLRATYDLVEKELLTAEKELEGYEPTTYFRITKTGVQTLLSRLYLYEQKWDKCIEYSTLALKTAPKLLEFATAGSVNVYDVKSTEIIWNYPGATRTSPYILANSLTSGGVLPYQLSQKVVDMYEIDDMRNCKTPASHAYSMKYVGGSASTGFYAQKTTTYNYFYENGLRTAELYVNRAEAYAQKGDVKGAIDDLNTLRQNRFHALGYKPLEITDKAELIQFVRDERQREFVWEGGLRWMDIKRYGMSVTHKFIDEDGTETTYTLEANSPLYALPIPNDAILKNPDLQQNKR